QGLFARMDHLAGLRIDDQVLVRIPCPVDQPIQLDPLLPAERIVVARHNFTTPAGTFGRGSTSNLLLQDNTKGILYPELDSEGCSRAGWAARDRSGVAVSVQLEARPIGFGEIHDRFERHPRLTCRMGAGWLAWSQKLETPEAVSFRGFLVVAGLDLNQRPLGY